MNAPRTHRVWGGVLGAIAVLGASPLAAQTPLGGGVLYREFDIGWRAYDDRPAPTDRALFEQYRELTPGLVVPNLRLWFLSGDGRGFVDVSARNVGRDDQRYRLTMQDAGIFRLRFERDETPHLISTDARMLGTISANGDTLSLPSLRPDTATWNATAPFLAPVGISTTNNRAQLVITPASWWAIRTDYDHTTREGNRPMGMDFSGSSGPTREILEPVQHTLNRLRISPSLVRPAYQLQMSYEYSSFENANSAVIADSPVLATSATTGSITGSSVGRTALAPSNHAQTLAASGGLRLGAGSRLTASASFSWRTQTQGFVPRTINALLDTSAFSPLPANLGGDTRTSMVNVGWTTRLAPRLMLSARYTLFDLSDQTPDVSFKGSVTTDRSISQAVMTREKSSFSRQTAVAEMSWHIAPSTTARVSDTWEIWNRNPDTRSVSRSSEHTPRFSLSVAPTDWLDLRAAYRFGWRQADNYNTNTSPGNSPNLRQYDLADRTTERFDISADVTPLVRTSFDILYGVSREHYDNSGYGLLKNDNATLGADLSWAATTRLTFAAGVEHQTYDMIMSSQVRSAVQNSNALLTWTTNMADVVNSANASADAAIMPRKLDVGISWDQTSGTSSWHNFNPFKPSGADPATLALALATDFPDRPYHLWRATMVVRYHVNETWTASARFSREELTLSDFRTAGLTPASGGQFYLGDDLRGYTAGYFTFTIAYRPWVPGLRHGLF